MKININTILIIAVVALVTWTVRGCLTKSPPNEKLIRNEERLKALEEKRVSDSAMWVERLGMKDSLIAISKQKSVILSGQFVSTKKRLNEIPAIVNDFDREQLRRAVSDFQ